MPHTLFFYLRRIKEGYAGTSDVVKQAVTRNAQMMVSIPGKHKTKQEENYKETGGNEKGEEGFTLEEQAPVKVFVPGRKRFSEKIPHAGAGEWNAGKADVSKAVVIILRGIIRNAAGSLRQERGIFEVAAGKRAAVGIAQHGAIGGVDDDPAALDEHFGDDVLGLAVRIEEKQAASIQA
jgi:hypothetical protein